MKTINYTLATAAFALLASCGGGGGENEKPPTAMQGKFIDSPVAGLNYVCGAFSGVTTADGVFDFEPGNTCTFSIGGITIGSAAAAAIITPVELVAGASDAANATVIRIAQLLQSLDADADPANGILITSSTRTALANVSLNITGASFNSDATAAVTRAYSNRTLVDASSAQTHMDQSLLGLLAGNYECDFSYSNTVAPQPPIANYITSGTINITIKDGFILGVARSSDGSFWNDISGQISSSGRASYAIAAGTASCGGDATFTGDFLNNGEGSGTLSGDSGGISGRWSCRAGGAGDSGLRGCGGSGGGGGGGSAPAIIP